MTDDLKERLLPCPYCAGEAHIYTTSQDSDTSVTAQCKECGAEMNFWLPWTAGDGQKAQAWQDVMNRWNTRALDPRITDLEARLAAAVEVQDRLMSERYQQYLRAKAAEAGEDALAEALQCWIKEEEGKGRSGTITAYNALAAYEARRRG